MCCSETCFLVCSNQRCSPNRFPQMRPLRQMRHFLLHRLLLTPGQLCPAFGKSCPAATPLHAIHFSIYHLIWTPVALPVQSPCLTMHWSCCSAPQASSKAQTDSNFKQGPQPPKPKGQPDYDKAGPLADWLRDAAKEMKKQGVNQKFTVSAQFSTTTVFLLCTAGNANLQTRLSLRQVCKH